MASASMSHDFKRVTDYLDAVERTDPVPCNGCTACCRHNIAVVIDSETWGDDPSKYGDNVVLEKVGEGAQLTLKRHPNGDCVFLIDGGCSIYADRPMVCRQFDCRRAFKGFTRQERKHATRVGLFPKEVLDAGRDRLGTLKLLPDEERMLRYVGLHQLGKVRG